MRLTLVRVLLVGCCLVASAAFAVFNFDNPIIFAGTFAGDDLTLTLDVVSSDPGPEGRTTYSGSLRHRDQGYPVSATLVHAELGRITGVFESAGQRYPFEATLQAGALVFVTGASSYSLARQPDDTGRTAVYECRRHGFRLSYPSTWVVTEEPDQVAFTPVGPEAGYFQEVSFVLYAPWLASQDGAADPLFQQPLEQVADMAIAELQQGLTSFQLQERASMTTLFAPATRFRFTALDPDTQHEMTVTAVFLRTEDAIYSVAYGAPSNLYQHLFVQEFESMLRSLSVYHVAPGF